MLILLNIIENSVVAYMIAFANFLLLCILIAT